MSKKTINKTFLPGDFISGKATGRLKVLGDFNKPSVSADLSCENIIINEFPFIKIRFSQRSVLNPL